jgi:hypothetical protein
MRIRLYAAPTRYEACSVRASRAAVVTTLVCLPSCTQVAPQFTARGGTLTLRFDREWLGRHSCRITSRPDQSTLSLTSGGLNRPAVRTRHFPMEVMYQSLSNGS